MNLEFWSRGQLMGVVMLLLALLSVGELAALVWLGRRVLRLRRSPQFDRLAQQLRQVETRLERIEQSRTSRDKGQAPRLTRVSAPVSHEHPPGPTLIAVPDLAIEPQPLDEELATALRQRNAEVWSLVGSGVPADEVARRTGQPIGQVELVEGLYRRIHATRGSNEHASA
jgi:hypothetical protein